MKIEEVPELTLPIIKPNRDYFCQYCDKVKGNLHRRTDLCGSSSQGWLVCVYKFILGFPHGSTGESACHRSWVDPWAGKIPGEGNGKPLQYSCQENPVDRGAWRATVYGVAQNWTQLND